MLNGPKHGPECRQGYDANIGVCHTHILLPKTFPLKRAG